MRIDRQGGFLISKIHRLSGRVFARMLKEHDIEINPAQGRILFVLWKEDGIPIRDLARRTSLGKSTLTSMLDRLEGSGHIVRERSETDRRAILVKRTDKDRAAQAAYERVSKAMAQVYYSGLADAEIDAFERTLERILGNLIALEGGNPKPTPEEGRRDR
jgi:DNA-binding MarR family transcriptional regulator